ncbi:2OG-Fe(II) oxygenase [Bordetella sp. H567]|uniref:2OG-Fe(II) oxygenase n=1 Tax=Bordetella sp. H567 TaxID=1697043 RepID=UPI0009F174F1|nr:2OG-Fe(II) oxygenase [Bordetella sp. H567]
MPLPEHQNPLLLEPSRRQAHGPAQPHESELDRTPAGLHGQDWAALAQALDSQGCGLLPGLLSDAQCDALAGSYDDAGRFRSRVVMSRHGFGRGEYQYFAYPLPGLIQGLREQAYPHLVPIANRWNAAMGNPVRYPPTHAGFLRRCHQAGQARPTPLLLRYGPGDYNCLHQDLYGEHVFPLQIAVLLSRPDSDYTGGEFVLTEQRPRMQSRVEVVPLNKGDAVVFAVNERPVQGTRGVYRVKLRHGVSRLRTGQRHVLGVIFHDAA